MVEETVTITATRYAERVAHETKFDLLTSALFNSAYSFGGGQLYFSDDPVRMLMKAYFPNSYQKKLDELKKAEEDKAKEA